MTKWQHSQFQDQDCNYQKQELTFLKSYKSSDEIKISKKTLFQMTTLSFLDDRILACLSVASLPWTPRKLAIIDKIKKGFQWADI